MMEALRNYWAGLSGRERKMMIAAGALAVLILGWLLLRPVIAIGADLRQTHHAAIEREGRVAAKLAMLKLPARSVPSSATASLSQYAAQSASEVGLSLSRNEARGNGASIAISSGKARVVMAWIADLESNGFAVDALTMTPQADGTVGLTAELRAAAR